MKRGGGRGSGRFNPFFNRFGNFQKQKEKPLFTLRNSNSLIDDDEDEASGSNPTPQPTTSDISFTTDREPGAYLGWKLYFPTKSTMNFD
jgi:hypothetical protein